MALPQRTQRPSSSTHPSSTTRPMPVPTAAGDPLPGAGGTAEQRRDDPLYESDLFRIHCYKVLLCGKRYAHDWMRCPFRHPGEKAARRPLNESSWYSATMCPDLHGTTCPRGDACGFAHNVFEHWLHPDRYRTQLCRDGAACSRRVCFFAHSIQQLRTPTGRVIAAADSAEAEAAAAMVAAAGWAIPGAGGNDAGASGLMADGPLLDSAYPRPLADMIVYTPPHGSDTAPAPSYGAAAGALCNYGATSIPSPVHSGLHQTAASLLGSAAMTTAAVPSLRFAPAACWPSGGQGQPSAGDVFQALMLDASDKKARAEAAAAAATRAHTAVSEAAALIGHLTMVRPSPTASGDTDIDSSTGIAATSPCLPYDARGLATFAGQGPLLQSASLHTTHLREQPLNRHSTSASCSALLGGSPQGTAAPLSPAGLSGARGAPLLRFLSGDQVLSGAGVTPAFIPAPLSTTAAMVAAPGAEVQLQPRAAPTVWYGSL